MANIAKISGGILITRGTHITFFNGTNEQDILTVQNASFGNVIEGRSVEDIFLGMNDGIAHFNGSDVQYLFKFPDINFRGFEIVKMFPTSVFIVTYNWNTNLNIIYRGYLK